MESLQGISVIFRSIQNNLICFSCPNTCILDIHLTVKYSNKEVPYLVQTSISSSISRLLQHLYLLVKQIERNSPETGYWTTNIQTCPHAYMSNIKFPATNCFLFYLTLLLKPHNECTCVFGCTIMLLLFNIKEAKVWFVPTLKTIKEYMQLKKEVSR